MKTALPNIAIFMLAVFIFHGSSFGQANTTLSNLASPTNVNQSLLPAAANIDLGNGAKRWRFIYADSMYLLKNTRSIYTRGTANFFAGLNAGNLTFTGTNNSAFGYLALSSFTSGYYNTALGSRSLASMITGESNVAVGYAALSASTGSLFNTAVGSYALYNSTGERNIAIGHRSLYDNSTGSYNSAVGGFALTGNTTGSYNTASGYSSLHDNQAGNYNTATGYFALTEANNSSFNTATGYNCMQFSQDGDYNTATGAESLLFTHGDYNTANGFQALRANFTGTSSTAVGYYALRTNGAGSGNTAVGSLSMQQNSTGNFNTAIGRLSGSANTTGSYNTSIGYNANLSAGTFTNATSLGYSALSTASNQVRIGNSLVTSIGGYANWTNISDKRVKKNIREDVAGLVFINRLKAVTYNLDINAINKKLYTSVENQQEPESGAALQAKTGKEKITYTGFIAQDVELAAKEAGYDFSGIDAPKNENDLYGLRYAEFVVPLVKAVQELSAQNSSLKEENNMLKSRLDKIETLLKLKDGAVAGVETGRLEQNSPNPFKGTTSIDYTIFEGAGDASIVVTDAGGKILKTVKVNSGKGRMTFSANDLAAGTYYYSLFVAGRLIDSKHFLVLQ